MKTIKNLTTFIDDKSYNCEVYHSLNGNDYFIIDDQPVDMKVLFHCDTLDGYIVITEDEDGQRMVWMCQESE